VQTISVRIKKLERLTKPEELPRIIVLEQGETLGQALLRLHITPEILDSERKRDRKIIWVRWAG
jgi:hypothetical protein